LRNLFTVLISFLVFDICVGQTVVDGESSSYKNLGKSITYIEDKTAKLTFDEVSKLPDSAYAEGDSEIFNGGTSGKTWWIKLRYRQNNSNPHFLVLGYGNVDFLDIYYKDTNSRVKHIKSGTFVPKDTRAFESSEFVYEINNIGGEVKEIYIRAKSVNTLLLPIKLTNHTTLTRALISKYTAQLFYVGIAFSIFLFYVFMYTSTKKKVYGFYLLRIFFLFYVYVLAYLNGYAHFFNIKISEIILIHAQAFAALGFIGTIYFDRAFLTIKGKQIRNKNWTKVLIVSWLALLVLSAWDTRVFTNRLTHVLLLATSATIIFNCIRTIKQTKYKSEDRYLIYYLLAWLPSCLATIYVVAALLKVIPFTDYTFAVLNVACLLEAIFMTFALLGDRLRLLKKEKEQAEREKIEIIKERNSYLEQKIEERTNALRKANEELTASNEFKDKLFSIIAHDMRTPLSSLKMVLQLADSKDIPRNMLHMLLDNIRKNTEQVQAMMDNLLNWAISQMKLQHYEPTQIITKDFLQEHLSLYKNLAENKGITTTLTCNTEASLFIDKNQLSLILRNLIDNAIKFTPTKGTIEISINEFENNFEMLILNSGEPIPEETISRILSEQKENLVTSYGTAREKGTGLGLQLCKEFLRNFDSKLEIFNVTIDDKNFSVFSFKIPKRLF
jgi:signal transduction histidine kinase